MDRGILRSVGVFTIVAVVLLALVLGGVQLVKGRNAQVANRGAAQSTQGNQNQPPGDPVKPPEASTPAPSQPTPQPQAPVQSTPTPAPQASAARNTAAPNQVPATGPAEDMIFTVALMMLAAYFAFVLRKAKLAYRRQLL